jgi:hypothetical protein
LAALALGLAGPARAWDSGAVLDVLRPGSHASVGLGGDPFLSPLEDHDGWWSRLDLGAPAGSLFELDSSRPIGLAQTNGFESLNAKWVTSATGRLANTAWTVGMGLDRPRWHSGWEGGSGGLTLEGSGTGAAIGTRVTWLPGLTWQLTGATGSGTAGRPHASFGAGVRYRHAGSVLQAAWQRAPRLDQLSSTLYGEPIGLSTNLVLESQRLDGRCALGFGVALEGALARARWVPVDAPDAALTYHLSPSGTSALDQLGLRWRSRPVAALVRWTQFTPDLAGDLAWGGQSFGGIDYARATLESWLAGLETQGHGCRSLAEVEHVRLAVRARGELESWPFTSTLVDLLGQRSIFRATGSVEWERWHLAHERPLGRRARGRAGAEWIEIRPAAEIESWRPAFLVFGKTDDRVDVLSVDRVRLGVVSLGLALPTGWIDLDMGLEQCVFARLERRERAPAAAASASDSEPAAAMRRPAETGTHVRLAASKRF